MRQNIYIANIHINEVRHLRDVNIMLSYGERKHLIITGKNGSGKTSLLEAMRDNISYHEFLAHNIQIDKMDKIDKKHPVSWMDFPKIQHNNVEISYSGGEFDFFEAVFVYISARRAKLVAPESIESFEMLGSKFISHRASSDFLKFILQLDYRLYGAKSENNYNLADKLTYWFNSFTNALRTIYDCLASVHCVLFMEMDTVSVNPLLSPSKLLHYQSHAPLLVRSGKLPP